MPEDAQKRRLFEQCVHRHADSMYRVAYRMTGNSDAANELVQEAYLNAWRNLDSLNDPERMRSWMFAILRNQYSRLVRQLSRFRQLPAETLDSLGDRRDEPRESARQDENEALVSALNALEDHQRFPLLLVTMEGMSVDAAAEVLGIPRGTVLSRLHRGRERLRSILRRHEAGLEQDQTGERARP